MTRIDISTLDFQVSLTRTDVNRSGDCYIFPTCSPQDLPLITYHLSLVTYYLLLITSYLLLIT